MSPDFVEVEETMFCQRSRAISTTARTVRRANSVLDEDPAAEREVGEKAVGAESRKAERRIGDKVASRAADDRGKPSAPSTVEVRARSEPRLFKDRKSAEWDAIRSIMRYIGVAVAVGLESDRLFVDMTLDVLERKDARSLSVLNEEDRNQVGMSGAACSMRASRPPAAGAAREAFKNFARDDSMRAFD